MSLHNAVHNKLLFLFLPSEARYCCAMQTFTNFSNIYIYIFNDGSRQRAVLWAVFSLCVACMLMEMLTLMLTWLLLMPWLWLLLYIRSGINSSGLFYILCEFYISLFSVECYKPYKDCSLSGTWGKEGNPSCVPSVLNHSGRCHRLFLLLPI